MVRPLKFMSQISSKNSEINFETICLFLGECQKIIRQLNGGSGLLKHVMQSNIPKILSCLFFLASNVTCSDFDISFSTSSSSLGRELSAILDML